MGEEKMKVGDTIKNIHSGRVSEICGSKRVILGNGKLTEVFILDDGERLWTMEDLKKHWKVV
jgi:hypothetical protein